MKHVRDQTIGAHTDIGSADDEVMRFNVGDLCFFVGGDAFVLIVPFCEQEANGTTDQLWQVTIDEPGVFASEFDLATEAQIVTNEDTGSRDNSSWEFFIMAVSKPKNPAIIVAGFLGVDFHQTKIALAFMAEAVCLSTDGEVGGLEGVLNLADELMMRDWAPAICGAWCPDFTHFIQLHVLSAAVENEVGCFACGDDRMRIEVCNHGGGSGLVMKKPMPLNEEGHGLGFCRWDGLNLQPLDGPQC